MSSAIRTEPYIVDVRYREPGYEARTGGAREPYRFRYRVDAGCGEAAAELALKEFNYIASISGVGWVREIVGLEVSLVSGL